jgi:replicative DNA helicase
MPKILADGDKGWSMEAEAAVLGSMLMDNKCIPKVLVIVTVSEMFYLPEHRIIFDALVSLHIRQKPVDPVILFDELEHTNQLERIGGHEYIAKLMETLPSSANAVYYAKVLRDKFHYRKMFNTVLAIQAVPKNNDKVNEQIEQIQQLALSLQIDKEDDGQSFSDNVSNSVKALAHKHLDCLPTGFRDLDRIIHGFHPWEMIVIAGRPGMGKSTISRDIALHVTEQEDNKVVIFSLEMGAEATMQGAVCALAKIDGNSWGHGGAPEHELEEARNAAEQLSKRDIVIYETIQTAKNMYAMLSVMSKVKAPKLVIVDNIQIMTTQPQIQKEYERLTEISHELKRITMNLKIPVIVISHLNREVEKRQNHIPRVSDLRGSGSIEQDADIIIMLHREDQYRKLEDPNIETSACDGKAQVIVAKNRRGRTGIATLLFREEFTRFDNMAPEQLDDCPI